MRAKVILPVLVLALVVLVSAAYFHNKSDEPAPAPQPVANDDSTNAAPAALPAILHRVAAQQAQSHEGAPIQEDAAADLKAADHEEYVTQRKAELYQMGLSKDPASLQTILTELHNTDPDIRQTALTATMDFGSTNAIPALRNEMAWAEDPHDKIEVQKVINFLQLQPFALDEKGAITQDATAQSSPAN